YCASYQGIICSGGLRSKPTSGRYYCLECIPGICIPAKTDGTQVTCQVNDMDQKCSAGIKMPYLVTLYPVKRGKILSLQQEVNSRTIRPASRKCVTTCINSAPRPVCFLKIASFGMRQELIITDQLIRRLLH